MLKKMIDYIKDEEFSINITKNKINIINFKQILILEDKKIVIISPYNKIIIKGEKLSINKLLEDEILISGNFNSIELGE